MSKIFSSLNKFSPQSKKTWIEKFLSESKKNKLKNIQHKINGELFDPIYFKDEIQEQNTFEKKESWKV